MIALTIDCEQWNAPLLRGIETSENNNTDYSKKGNLELLRILDELKIKATFFVTGFFAEKEPEQVRNIFEKGHEVASHGYSHFYRHSNFSKGELEKDILKSKEKIEKVIKKRVIGFRSPQLQYSEELIRILDKTGFKYDSSLHPAFVPGYYNNLSASLSIHRPIKNLKIKEIPIGVIPYIRQPISWVWMRCIGNWWTGIGVNALLRRKISPVVYFHSWEFTKIKSRHVPFYFRYRTGGRFAESFSSFIKTYKKEGFVMLSELI